MRIASQPLHGVAVVAHIFYRYTVIAYYSIFLQKVHNCLPIHGADVDPIVQLVAHFGLMESLIIFKATKATPTKNTQLIALSTIGIHTPHQ
jgi:hypothetical protein